MSDDQPRWRPPDQPAWRPPDQPTTWRPPDQSGGWPSPSGQPPVPIPPQTGEQSPQAPHAGPGWAAPPGPVSGPPGYAYPPLAAPPVARRNRTLFVVIAIVAALVIALLVIAFLIGSSLGSLAGLGTRTPIEDVAIGQCFDGLRTSDNRIFSPAIFLGVEIVDCADEHHAELIGRSFWTSAGGDAYPGEEQLEAFAYLECGAMFERYVGIAYFESALQMAYLYPYPEDWDLGWRSIECVVHPPVGIDKEAGSVRGSRR